MIAKMVRIFSLSVLLVAPSILALTSDDIPSQCRSQCSSSVNLLNGCGVDTSGNNANPNNSKCFCDGSDKAGYNE
jgi:hypothetical protein